MGKRRPSQHEEKQQDRHYQDLWEDEDLQQQFSEKEKQQQKAEEKNKIDNKQVVDIKRASPHVMEKAVRCKKMLSLG
jgi:hypothetical protein